MECGYGMGWAGKCKKETPCPHHSHLVCFSCGNKATHECDETGQFVCGCHLCDDCEHTIAEDGTNGGVGFVQTSPHPPGLKSHCRKSEQVYKPWYARE